MGKSSMEPKITEEIEEYIAHFITPNLGKPFHMNVGLSQATANIVSQLLYGGRTDYDDKKFITLIEGEWIAVLIKQEYYIYYCLCKIKKP